MEEGCYDDWIAMEETHDYHCPIEAQLEAELLQGEIEMGLWEHR